MTGQGDDIPAELNCVVEFLREIGIAVAYEPGARGFVDGVRIERGGLAVDRRCRISSLLHEGAHCAITPRRFRHLMNGNLHAGRREMYRQLEAMQIYPDALLYRAAIQNSDAEATAWAYAAGRRLGLSADRIIGDDEYDGEGRSIRLALSVNAHPGIKGLARAGFCALRQGGRLPLWPELAFWTQEVDVEAS